MLKFQKRISHIAPGIDLRKDLGRSWGLVLKGQSYVENGCKALTTGSFAAMASYGEKLWYRPADECRHKRWLCAQSINACAVNGGRLLLKAPYYTLGRE